MAGRRRQRVGAIVTHAGAAERMEETGVRILLPLIVLPEGHLPLVGGHNERSRSATSPASS